MTTTDTPGPAWPDTLTRVPYWAFLSPDVYPREQERIFRGPYWSYLCLEIEVGAAGEYCTSFVGDTPVIVTRDHDGELYAFENRCAHRGALLALDDRGTGAKGFTCVYHAWSYSLQGDLTGVAFQDGIQGSGGMPPSFCLSEHGPRKLRLAEVDGLVFGSFSPDVPDIEDYLGPQVLGRIHRVLGGRRPVVIGRFTQMLPNNWKLYLENVKDSYHASILHLFFTTFEINKLSQRGGIIVDDSGAHHVSYSAVDRSAERDTSYTDQSIRSSSDHRLADPSLLEGFSEVGDDITLQILTVFPGLVLQQIQNAIAVRQVLPRGTDRTELRWVYLGFADDTPEQHRTRLRQANLMGPAGYVSMEDGCVGGFVQRGVAGAADRFAVVEMGGDDALSSSSRVTEASVRGFWKAYRAAMGYGGCRVSDDLLGRIVRAQAGYARCIDNGLLEQWPGFFTEKCLYVVTTADNHREGLDAGLIWADTRAMLTDRVTSLRDANIYERHTYRHLLGQPYLLGEFGDTVESETPFLVARVMRDGATDVFATGRYLDTFHVGEDLLLARRVVVCDSSRIDTLLALPL